MIWEMGSEFHLIRPWKHESLHGDAFQGELFVNGRAALHGILDRVQLGANGRIWIPSYVCREVHVEISSHGTISTYGDYPDEHSPRFDTLQATRGDVILIQDTFGLGDVGQWHDWLSNHEGLITIEDISHSSMQERFLQSPADHVFSSLRKSQPTADGGIVFSRESGLVQSQQTTNPGSRQKLEAMILKELYLQGYPIEKRAFRELQIAGERELNKVNAGGSLPHTQAMLQLIPFGELRDQWRRNTMRLRCHLSDAVFSGMVVPLQSRGGEGLFHLVVKFESMDLRDRIRDHLVDNRVYPAIHWLQDHNLSDAKAINLSQKVLTLPTDYRYADCDIDRLASIIREGLRGTS